MKLSVGSLDDEIREAENRIALDRLALEDAIAGCKESLKETLRETVSSPKAMLGVVGVGFMLGKFLFGRKAPPVVVPQKAGALGLLTGLAGTALSLMQPGLAGSITRLAMKAFAERQPRAQSASAPAPKSSPAPAEATPPRSTRREVAS